MTILSGAELDGRALRVNIDRGTVSVPEGEALPTLPNKDALAALLTEHITKSRHRSSGMRSSHARKEGGGGGGGAPGGDGDGDGGGARGSTWY